MKQISSKRTKTDADFEELARIEFLAALYMDENGPVIAQKMIEAMTIQAAKKVKEGPVAKSGCFCLQNFPLQYDGPRTADALWADDRFHFSALVRVQTSRVARMRPIFRQWETVITLNVETSLVNVARVDEWMRIAGTQIGLGDWRPQYGRFTVERVNG